MIQLSLVAKMFLRLGITAFGGPAAHIAMMHREMVVKKQWLTNDAFLKMVSATQLIPGPNSTELAIHIGHKKGGRKGLLVAGACFIIPAVLITLAFAWLYAAYGYTPALQPVIAGISLP